MPIVSRIEPQSNRPTRLNIYLDGRLAFALDERVVRQFRLEEGANLDPPTLRQIEMAELHRELVENGMKLAVARMHSRSELTAKLQKRGAPGNAIDAALDDLQRMGYIDDAKYAEEKARYLREQRKLDRRRAEVDLLQSGIRHDLVCNALDEAYGTNDPLAAARELIAKEAPKLSNVSPQVARRRLAGMLARRGFDYESVRKLLDDALGPEFEYGE